MVYNLWCAIGDSNCFITVSKNLNRGKRFLYNELVGLSLFRNGNVLILMCFKRRTDDQK